MIFVRRLQSEEHTGENLCKNNSSRYWRAINSGHVSEKPSPCSPASKCRQATHPGHRASITSPTGLLDPGEGLWVSTLNIPKSAFWEIKKNQLLELEPTKPIKIFFSLLSSAHRMGMCSVCVWTTPTALKINIWVVHRGQDWALYVAGQDTERLYITDNTELCRERKGDACWWDTASCPQTDWPPLSFGSVQGTVWLPDSGSVLESSSSITHSVCPTLADWIQPTSCCGDVCVGACKVGGTDVCMVGGGARCYREF